MSQQTLPTFQLGPFASDIRRFVGAVLGVTHFRLAPEGEQLDDDETAYAVLVDPERGRLQVVVARNDQPATLRSPEEMRAAQAEADAVIADYEAELKRLHRAEEAASEQIERAHDAIKQAEHDLTEAKHTLRTLDQRRSNARTKFWLAMDNVAGFGRRDPR